MQPGAATRPIPGGTLCSAAPAAAPKGKPRRAEARVMDGRVCFSLAPGDFFSEKEEVYFSFFVDCNTDQIPTPPWPSGNVFTREAERRQRRR